MPPEVRVGIAVTWVQIALLALQAGLFAHLLASDGIPLRGIPPIHGFFVFAALMAILFWLGVATALAYAAFRASRRSRGARNALVVVHLLFALYVLMWIAAPPFHVAAIVLMGGVPALAAAALVTRDARAWFAPR